MERNEIVWVVREFMEEQFDKGLSIPMPKTRKDKLINVVCGLLKVNRELLSTESKTQKLTYARRMIAVYSLIYTNFKMREIAEMIGRKHPDVSYYIRTSFEQVLNGSDPYIKGLFARIREEMKE